MNNSIRIIAWDVGIKNLAYCMIKKNEDNTFKIEKWKNINLIENDEHKCGAFLKKKNKSDIGNTLCESGASYYCEVNNEIKYYCGTHKSQHVINIVEIEKQIVTNYENKSKEKCKFTSTKLKNNCNKKAEFIINGCICCKNHKELQLKNKIAEISIKPIKVQKCTDLDPQALCETMYKKLSQEEFKDIDRVYIENQPTLKNPSMKAVSSMLHAYFVYLFISNNLDNKIVKFVSPSFKIKFSEELIKFINLKLNSHKNIKSETCKCRICTLATELELNKTNFGEDYKKYDFSYDSVKELGIIYTQKILKDNNTEDDFNMINIYTKKDDVCDAFLHGYRKLL